MEKQNKGKKYLHLAAGTVIMLFLGLIYAWSIFRAPFGAIYTDWTLSQLSLTFTISMIFFCIGGLAGGKLLTRLKSNVIVLISAAALCLGFFLCSRLNPNEPQASLVMLYIFYGVLCGFGVGVGYNAVISAVMKWFPGREGFASGVLLMGFGLGGLLLGSIVSSLVSSVGLFQAFLYLAIGAAVVLVAGSFFVRMPDAPMAAAKGRQGGGRDYSPAEMLKTPVFWLFFVWNVVISASGFLVINSAAVIAAAFGAPAVLGLLVSVFNGAGRITFGSMIDKIGRTKALYASSAIMLIAGACLYFGAVTGNVILIFAGLLLVGLSFGSSPAMSSQVVNSFFGPKNYPVNLSLNNFLIVPAAIIGPMISSAMQESSGGKYDTTFLMVVVFAVLAFILNAALNKAASRMDAK
jgi:OFA family oxalate/formate antiporter-like MFS transporter